MENPFYSDSAPLRAPDLFFDRQAETKYALDLLKSGNSISVIGLRGIGKTSFLVYLSLPGTLNRYGLLPEEYVFAFVDGYELSSEDECQSYARISEAVSEAARERKLAPIHSGAAWVPGPRPYRTLRKMVKDLVKSGLRIVMVLDEFEHITGNSSLRESFFTSLRSLIEVGLLFVTATHTSLRTLQYAQMTDAGSVFLNSFRPLRLGLLELQSSRDMVQSLLKKAKGRLDPAIVEWIVQVGGNHPFLIQVAGYWAWEMRYKSEEIGVFDTRRLRSQVYESAKRHLCFIWQHLSQEEQKALATLPNELHTPIVERLIELGLVVERNGRYWPFSPLFRTFIRTQFTARSSSARLS